MIVNVKDLTCNWRRSKEMKRKVSSVGKYTETHENAPEGSTWATLE